MGKQQLKIYCEKFSVNLFLVKKNKVFQFCQQSSVPLKVYDYLDNEFMPAIGIEYTECSKIIGYPIDFRLI
jgi:hypothetical protein